MVDKYKVRKHIENAIGKQYLIPLIGFWESPEEICFEKLPDQFVLKCTHDSGGVAICKDKATFDIKAARKLLSRNVLALFQFEPCSGSSCNKTRKTLLLLDVRKMFIFEDPASVAGDTVGRWRLFFHVPRIRNRRSPGSSCHRVGIIVLFNDVCLLFRTKESSGSSLGNAGDKLLLQHV